MEVGVLAIIHASRYLSFASCFIPSNSTGNTDWSRYVRIGMSAISALDSPANGFPRAPAEDEAEPSRSAFSISYMVSKANRQVVVSVVVGWLLVA